MPNRYSTSLSGISSQGLGPSFETKSEPSLTHVQPQQPLDAKVKATPRGLVTLLAKSLGASRPDWRNNPHAHITYASSRVRYVEEGLAQEQIRQVD